MSECTTVELLWIEGRVERWIRFGRAAEETILTATRRTVGFDPDTVFAFVRWSASDFGTVESRIDVLRATRRTEAHSTIPHVVPGAEILLHLGGWPKVEAVLRVIDHIESLGITPEDVCPDHWRHVHNRMVAGLEPRPYTELRHAAWLDRAGLRA